MIEVTWETLPLMLLMIAIAVLGVARVTRVLVYDEFPPTMWIREMWLRLTRENAWAKLWFCWWCMSVWIAALCVGWWIAGLYVLWAAWSWWIFWGIFALAYLAPMVIVRDEPDGK